MNKHKCKVKEIMEFNIGKCNQRYVKTNVGWFLIFMNLQFQFWKINSNMVLVQHISGTNNLVLKSNPILGNPN